MSRPELSISFHNFESGFVPAKFSLVRGLAERFDVKIETLGRDIQFFSVWGKDLIPTRNRPRALRVWTTGEPYEPRHMLYDLHFGFLPESLMGKRWIRRPLWSTIIDWWDESSAYSPQRLLGPRPYEPREKFCNFIYTNRTSFRTEFFDLLGKRRKVDSLGRVLNNSGGPCVDKLETVGEYQFTIAFENSLSPGYVTEKLIDPLAARSIPIYWGASEAKTDINPEAFIFARDFESFDDLADHVIKVSESREAMERLVTAPLFTGGAVPEQYTNSYYVDRIVEALSSSPGVSERHAMNDTLIADQAIYGTRRTSKQRFRQSFRKRMDKLARFLAR